MGLATREAYGNALKEYGSDERIVVLDADLSKSTKTYTFKSEYPERFFNMGIAEQNLTGVAAGLSTCGKIPFMSSFAVFAAGRAFEIIRNSICYPKLNVKICATHAGLTVGQDGASHQAIEDLAIMRTLPNMIVLNPSDAYATNQLIKELIDYKGPSYMRLGRSSTPDIYENNEEIKIGKANVLREGTDATVIATGIMVSEALKAYDELKKENINIRVLDFNTIKPLDKEAVLKAAKETKKIIVAEEHSIIGGLGSAVSEYLSEVYPTLVLKVGVKDTFGESGDGKALLEKYGLTYKEIIKRVKENEKDIR